MNRQGRKVRARRRGTVGLGTAASAFFAFGVTPLATAPAAKADAFDLILEPILNSLASVDPTLATDLSALASSIDPTALGDNTAAAAALPDPSALPAAATPDLAQLLDQYIYTPIQTSEQAWITSPFGEQVDNFLNTSFGQTIIGNGAAGTEAQPDGEAGGLLFGNGGNGWNSTFAGVPGGNGGDAYFGDGGNGGVGGAGTDGGAGGNTVFGIGGAGGAGGPGVAGLDNGVGGAGGPGGAVSGFFGDGGTGGDGGQGVDGAVGGDGGDGGSATGLVGSGGDGGAGGNGGTSGDLPALGGAGGSGGLLGSHGAVGDDVTLAVVSSGAGGAVLPLGTTGSWLTNSDGQVVMLHGLNEVYKVAPFEPAADGFGAQDAAFLAENGFNAVRLGVIWSAVEPEPGVFNTAYLNSIEQTVQTLSHSGIYTILDFHEDGYSGVFGGEGAPEWAVQTDGAPNLYVGNTTLTLLADPAYQQAWDSFWSNAEAPNGVGLEDDYSQMLQYVANAFNGNPDVAGIEIINEPWPGSDYLDTLLGSSFFDQQQLTPFYDQAASAIRAVDPTTPIFYEDNFLSNFGIPNQLGTVDATNTVLSFHAYCDLQLGSLGCFPNVAEIVNNAETYANAHNIPAVMTEFGATSDQSKIIASMQAADQKLIGWTEWAFTGQGDITTSAAPPSTESLVYNPELPPAGSNVNTANLDTLAEPYPQDISGTPDSYSFSDGTLQFSYSTEEADGLGSFPAGSQTTISVPAVEFPNGYQVSVTGGEVMSTPNAPELVVASDGGAGTVAVTVTADGAAGAG